MTQLSLDPLFDFTVYALQVCSSFLPAHKLHISFSCRNRKGITSLLPWWGSTNTTYIERFERVIQWNLWVLFWKLIKTPEQWWNNKLETLCLTWSFYLSITQGPSEGWEAPWLKVIWISLKVRLIWGEFLFERMCTFEELLQGFQNP